MALAVSEALEEIRGGGSGLSLTHGRVLDVVQDGDVLHILFHV